MKNYLYLISRYKNLYNEYLGNLVHDILKEKFASLPPDEKIEELPIPPTGAKIYIRGEYEPFNIQAHIEFFVKKLDINLDISTIQTRPLEGQSHKYTNRPAKPVRTFEDFELFWRH